MSRPAFVPDSSVVAEVMPSPNHGERSDGRQPDMILLHYTGMADTDAALVRLRARSSNVSAHYFIFEDGRIIQMVPESRRAWHAGKSEWAGETDINSCSIGIEIANPGHDYGYPDFPARQIAAVTALCRSIQPATVLLRCASWLIPMLHPRANKIPAKSFPGARSMTPVSVTG
jgi:N-acetylmuramoyl-L-alanine amidase